MSVYNLEVHQQYYELVRQIEHTNLAVCADNETILAGQKAKRTQKEKARKIQYTLVFNVSEYSAPYPLNKTLEFAICSWKPTLNLKSLLGGKKAPYTSESYLFPLYYLPHFISRVPEDRLKIVQGSQEMEFKVKHITSLVRLNGSIPHYKYLDNFNLSHQLIDKGYNDPLVCLINTTNSVLQSLIIIASISH